MIDKIENHPVDKIYNSGVSMSINTDARTISDVDLGKEYETLERYFNWEKEHFLNVISKLLNTLLFHQRKSYFSTKNRNNVE